MSYRAYAPVIAAAQTGRAGLRHLVFGCGVVLLLGYMFTSLLLEMVISSGALSDPFTLFDGTTPATMLILLFSFGVWPVALALALNIAHQRPFTSLLGRELLPQFRVVAVAMTALYAALLVLPPWAGSTVTQNTSLGLWLTLLPLGLLAVFVQVAAEELVFRGYLQQALAARGLPVWVWMGVPSALFGLGHYDASAGSNAWLIALWAVIFGLLMADLTARAGSIGPAIAVHMANNVAALLVIGLDDSLNGLALFVYPLGLSDEAALRALLPADFLLMLVSWLAARLVLRR